MSKTIKPSAVVHSIALPAKLELIAAEIASAIHESASLSETLGDLTRQAAKIVTKETLEPFVDACAQLCEAQGVKDSVRKVYLSNIRGVLRAMLSGYEPIKGLGLRAMYDARPGSGTQARVPRQTAKGAQDAPQEAPKPAAKGDDKAAKAEARKAAITALFGFYTPELAECVEYAAEHAGMFQTWAKASAKAAQQVPALKVA